MPKSSLDDHMSRLYSGDFHVDKVGAIIHVVRVLKNSIEIEISDEAIVDFLSDMDYQIEFNEGDYQAQCRYAYQKMKKNKLNNNSKGESNE